MTTITTRVGKGSPLTNNEMDTNLTNLNTDKVEGVTSSVDSEIMLFDGIGGKTTKRATTTGLLKAASGVIGAAVSGTDIKTINSTSLLGSGDIATGNVTGQASSVDSEIALFSSTTGKVIKRATTTGLLKATSGVIGAAVSGTDIKTINGVSPLGSGNIVISSLGSGGAAASGDVTLTSASDAMQSITPTGFGQAATLPNATTLSEGVTVFGIHNAGPYPYLIKDSTGTLLGFADTGNTVICSLVSNATAAGTWALDGASYFGIDAQAEFTTTQIGAGTAAISKVIVLDSDRTVIFMHSGTAQQIYAVCYNTATRTFGTPVLVRSSISVGNYCGCIKSATDQVLFVSSTSSTSTFEAVVLSVSGTSITVHSATTKNLSLGSPNNSYSDTYDVIQVGTSFVVGCWSGGTQGLFAISISGTTVSIGSEITVSAGNIRAGIFDMGGGVMIALYENTGTGTARPYTVSGTTMTAGTSATFQNTSANHNYFKFSSGRLGIFCNNSAGYVTGVVVSLSGTIASVSQTIISATTSITWSATGVFVSGTDAVQLTGSYYHAFSDSSGTAVARTELNGLGPGIITQRFSDHAYFVSATGRTSVAKISFSGGNPVLTVTGYMFESATPDPYKWGVQGYPGMYCLDVGQNGLEGTKIGGSLLAQSQDSSRTALGSVNGGAAYIETKPSVVSSATRRTMENNSAVWGIDFAYSTDAGPRILQRMRAV